jgi:hypothetical protein
MKVFNEEMCLLLKSCGLFYAEAIVILVTTKGSLNISVQCFKGALNIHFVTEKLKNMYYLDHKG